jgi:hypothetical protein
MSSTHVLRLHECAPSFSGRVSSLQPTRLPCYLSVACALAQATCKQHRPPPPHHPWRGVGGPSTCAHPRHLDSRRGRWCAHHLGRLHATRSGHTHALRLERFVPDKEVCRF